MKKMQKNPKTEMGNPKTEMGNSEIEKGRVYTNLTPSQKMRIMEKNIAVLFEKVNILNDKINRLTI